ncbi:uncharacterized protein LOC117289046 [Asterias rubens]|uniref:uncharacterized protein LOC117289046 n=1 Tax=Asterias rubens TaxID=7604 RepID=UPI0014554DB7|nr:uncharacterized protein LOC117289046 [Asterias rubens]
MEEYFYLQDQTKQDSDAQERDEAVFENASQLFSWDAVAQREIKEGVMALQDRLRQLEMKLSDCAELYEKRRERLVLKHRDARTAHVCNRILICSCLMVLISYIIRCLQTPHELCFQEH